MISPADAPPMAPAVAQTVVAVASVPASLALFINDGCINGTTPELLWPGYTSTGKVVIVIVGIVVVIVVIVVKVVVSKVVYVLYEF